MTIPRYLWTLPNTLLGLLMLPTRVFGGSVRIVRGVVEIEGPGVRTLFRIITGGRGAVGGLTLGHVILGSDAVMLERVREHEHVHVRQYERWGPAFLPAYFIASLVAWLRGEPIYRGNAFEREAFEKAP